MRRFGLPAFYLQGNMPWLLASRFARSFSQAILVVAVPLYVAAAGYSSLQIGYLLSVGALGSVVLVLAVGFLADRIGRKPVLIGIAALAACGAAVYAMTAHFALLAVTSALTALGRGGSAGSGGSFGPFYPAEQPLIAESCSDHERNSAFAAISFVGVLAAAAGSAVAALPDLLQAAWHVPVIDSFRPVFWISAVTSLVLILLILPIRETRQGADAEGEAQEATPGRTTLDATAFSLIWRIWVTNSLNGLASGVVGPFLTYWFYVRYGVGAAQVGSLYLLVNLISALPFLGAAAVARWLGAVRAVALSRFGTAVFLGAMALAPTYFLASAAYTLRVVVNSVGMPIRQSFIMGVAEARSRSTVAAMGSLPMQVTSVFSPSLAAYLLEVVSVQAPVWAAAGIFALNSILYHLVFHRFVPPEERDRQPARATL